MQRNYFLVKENMYIPYQVSTMTHHLHLVPRSKNAWSYISTPPIRLHGVVLS
jgi:hypothetical protein